MGGQWEPLNVRRYVEREQRLADLTSEQKAHNRTAQVAHWAKSREKLDATSQQLHATRQFRQEAELANTETIINRKARMKAFLTQEAAE
eukprot:scaffold104654_cov31-Tisochrysis_lutea.AAC.1